MQTLLKDLQNNEGVTAPEIGLFRSLIITISAFVAVKVSKEKYCANMEKKDWLPLILRCIAGTISFFTNSLAVKNIPLTLFQIIYNTLPFMIAIIVFIWLCERISKFEFAAMCFCFGGIILVAIYLPEPETEVN